MDTAVLECLLAAECRKRDLIFVSVTNVGSRAATVNTVGMRVGRWKKRHAVITAVKDAYSDGVPVTIADGQVAKWGISLENDNEWIKDLVKDFVLNDSDAKSLRFIVYTTHGHSKVLKPEPPLVDAIKQAIKDKNA